MERVREVSACCSPLFWVFYDYPLSVTFIINQLYPHYFIISLSLPKMESTPL